VNTSSGVRNGAPAENAFRRILKATERSLLHIYAEILWARPRFFGSGPNVEPRLTGSLKQRVDDTRVVEDGRVPSTYEDGRRSNSWKLNVRYMVSYSTAAYRQAAHLAFTGLGPVSL